MKAPLPYAMIGGGTGSFIGAIHRHALALDERAQLVAGAFSSSPDRSRASAADLGVAPERAYATYQELLNAEPSRADRPAFVVIVTPNDTHFPIAKACLEAGFPVVCDKPFTITSVQSAELQAIASDRQILCAVTYNYSGYPMVREARARIESGELGTIRKVFAEYHQGWLSSDLERCGHKQASWRTDPARAGIAGALGDIGTHAEHLVRFVTGLEIESVCADLTSFLPGRTLDDDASVLMRLSDGARGTLTCSQVCIGEANGLSLRVYGDRAGLVWKQEEPNHLTITHADGSKTIHTRGSESLSPAATEATRLPTGHPEGFIEAFANIYNGIIGSLDGPDQRRNYPDASDGHLGIRFVEACVRSSQDGTVWIDV